MEPYTFAYLDDIVMDETGTKGEALNSSGRIYAKNCYMKK